MIQDVNKFLMSFLVISGFVGKGGFLSSLIRSSVFVLWFMKYLYQDEKLELQVKSLSRV